MASAWWGSYIIYKLIDMANFEKLIDDDGRSSLNPEKQAELDVKEAIFTSIVLNELIENIQEAMDSSDYSEEEIGLFKESLNSLSSEDIKGIIAIPMELRERVFNNFRAKLDAGGFTPEMMVQNLHARAKEMGYTLGYHLSNKDIVPEKISRVPNEVTWSVNPSELDDRDDMQMAYYSLDYKNLFRKRSGRYLYVIRAEIGEGTPHKRDQSNNWGRAQKLSIVEKFDMSDLDKEIDTVYKETHNQEKTSTP